MEKLTIYDYPLENKHVLLRVDFNVPLSHDGKIQDDTRIRSALPTIEYILNQGCQLTIISHLGRPKGKVVKALSLAPCAKRLSELLNKPVKLLDISKEITREDLGPITLLENVRFYPGETEPLEHPEFTKLLAQLGDVYVNDAFGTAHRKHTSTYFLAQAFKGKALSGALMQKEIEFLSPLTNSPKRPFAAVLGGAKVSSKLGAIFSLLEHIDALFIGGGMVFTFLKALGHTIGNSICDDIDEAKKVMEACKKQEISLYLPEDIVITPSLDEPDKSQIVTIDEGVLDGWLGVDIGPKTIKAWSKALIGSKTIFWNGPLGVFEVDLFAKGTFEIAKYLSISDAITVIGGGDSVAAINQLGLSSHFSHISTGGGATLELIEKGHIPGLDALSNK